MAQALLSVAFMVAAVVSAAGGIALARRLKEGPRGIGGPVRSLTGGRARLRHRLHTRMFENALLLSVTASTVGAFSTLSDSSLHSLIVVGGVLVLIALWWGWRRGALRPIGAEQDDG